LKLLKPHQYAGQLWLRAHRRGICADEMRLGKSFTAAWAVANEGAGIVGCPASAKTIWRDEFLSVNPDLKIDIVKGRSHSFMSDADVYIANYDIVPDNFGKFPAHAKGNWVIADEFHYLKNFEARRTGAMQALIRNSRIAHPLSGTPMPSRPVEWWPILNALGITTLEWPAFAVRYCAAWPAPWASDKPYGLDASGASNLEELSALLAPHVLRRTKRQVIKGYVAPEIRLFTFDRPKDSRESAFTPEVLRQFDNPLLSLEGLSEVVKQSALKRVPDCAEFIANRLNEEPKIIVFAYHHEVLELLQSMLTEFPSVTVTGRTPQGQRDIARKVFREDPAVRIFYGNILAAGDAWDGSVADCSIFVQVTWVPKDLQQAVERTESMAKTGRRSSCYVLTTENSIDHYMVNRLFEKMNVIQKVLSF
jgi:SWI/SNF-related matrix-associated actin-dependent regulator of chromatin subfamily A-like protein 1